MSLTESNFFGQCPADIIGIKKPTVKRVDNDALPRKKLAKFHKDGSTSSPVVYAIRPIFSATELEWFRRRVLPAMFRQLFSSIPAYHRLCGADLLADRSVEKPYRKYRYGNESTQTPSR
jgi:hypothetical protein